MHIAVAGNIGSGKTTIEKLILRLYEPTSGTILIDGIDIKQITLITEEEFNSINSQFNQQTHPLVLARHDV